MPVLPPSPADGEALWGPALATSKRSTIGKRHNKCKLQLESNKRLSKRCQAEKPALKTGLRKNIGTSKRLQEKAESEPERSYPYPHRKV